VLPKAPTKVETRKHTHVTSGPDLVEMFCYAAISEFCWLEGLIRKRTATGRIAGGGC
jgi:hypothetical protein